MKTYQLEVGSFPDHTMMTLFDRQWTLTLNQEDLDKVKKAQEFLKENKYQFNHISIYVSQPNELGEQEDDSTCDVSELRITQNSLMLYLQGKWDWQDQYEFYVGEEV
jgi:hypothetical protein